jgi:hypothetical protein
LDFLFLAVGIIIGGYYIGDGLKNFRNPSSKSLLDDVFNEPEEEKLIKQSEIHHFIGITEEDAKVLLKEHPKIPHIYINNNLYFPKAKLRKWLANL